MVQQQLEIDDYLGILRRRWWLLLLLGILGAAIAYGTSLLLLNRYTSRSLVLVERQQVPDNFVQPVVTTDLDQRLATLEEQILSRTRLRPLIDNFGLFKEKEIFDLTRFKPVVQLLGRIMGQGSEASAEWRIEQTRAAIGVKPVQSIIQDPKGGLPGFYISFTYSNPEVAQQVCDRITSMFIDEDIRFREQAAQGTTDFIDSQLQDAKRQLDEQDARLAKFKQKYLGALPDDTQTNLSILTSLNMQLEGVTGSIQRTAQDKSYVESFLEQQLETLKSKASPATSQKDTLQKQLTQMESQLVQLKSEYTNKYPDVVNLTAAIEALKKKTQEKDAPPALKTYSPGQQPVVVEPQQIQQLRSQLRADEDNLKALYQEQKQLKNQINLYQSRVNMSPAIEQQYKEVTRDHQTALTFYDGLLRKKQQSAMAADLQRRQQGEQFHVMDPADLPPSPSFPNRPLFGLAGLGIGLMVGLGLIWLLEGRERILRTERDVEALLGIPTLAAVPNVVFRAESKVSLSTSTGKKGNT
jgi:protein tyrosine kinase modulator